MASRRGSPVRSQMHSRQSTSPHGNAAVEQYPAAPFSRYPRNTGNGGIPQKLMQDIKVKVPSSRPGGQTSAMANRATKSPGDRRYGK